MPPLLRNQKLYGIVFTFNNYTEEDVIRIKGCVGQRGISYICFGREVGEETGTPHLQGYLQSTQKCFKRLQKAVGPCAMAQANAESGPNESEVNNTFGKPYTAIGYCMKDGDFFETGLKQDMAAVTERQRTDLIEAMQAVQRQATELTLFEEHSAVMAKYPKFIDKYRTLVRNNTSKEKLQQKFSTWELYPWQNNIIAAVAAEADDRSILWVWSDAGKMGKSSFGTFLAVNHNALIIETGKKNDILHIFSKNPAPIVVIDIVKATKDDEIRHMYGIAESLKNGRIMSGKYDGDTIFFDVPHIIFFANFAPDSSLWSDDRLSVMKLD